MKQPYRFKAQCLLCKHEGTVMHNSKEEYQEVTVCPKCKGAFVDIWKINKYKQSESKGEEHSIQVDIIEKLEEVFVTACDFYTRTKSCSITEIRELGETIIKAKQNVHPEGSE